MPVDGDVLLQAAENKLASHNFSISDLMHRTYTSINFNSVIDIKLLFIVARVFSSDSGKFISAQVVCGRVYFG